MPRKVAFTVPEEDRVELAGFSKGSWQSVWVQGGRLTLIHPPAPGIYSVPALTIGGPQMLVVGATSEDYEWQDEVLFLSLGIDREFGQEDRERFFRPRRARLEGFPPDLDLSPFLPGPRSLSILRRHEERDGVSIAIDFALLVTSMAGEQLVIYCDDAVPFYMCLSRRADVVRSALEESSAIEEFAP